MKLFIFLCLAIAAASAETAIKVKWGIPIPLINTDFFIEIPRDETDIVSEGWVSTTRYEGAPLPSLNMYCPSEEDVTVCAMYDDTGYIAGLQIAIAKNSFTNPANPLESIGFAEWTKDGVEYWVQQQYYISEESLSLSAEERDAYRSSSEYATLSEGGLWVPDLEGQLVKVSNIKSDIASSIFTEQACIPTMGIHYYYNMSTSMSCDALYPWFLLVSYEEMIASGLVVFGEYTTPPSGQRMWFEQPNSLAVRTIVPRGPSCLYDLASDVGLITMHIYYTKQLPLTIGC